jgi:hypothetical protein
MASTTFKLSLGYAPQVPPLAALTPAEKQAYQQMAVYWVLHFQTIIFVFQKYAGKVGDMALLELPKEYKTNLLGNVV